MNIRFYHCPICGNIVVKITDSGRNLSCCGKEMVALVPKEMEEGNEKHLPFLSSVRDNILTVEIGEKPHPMEKDHHIQWVYLETEKGGQFVRLQPNDPPQVTFCCKKCHPIAIYAYCNVHGLWSVDFKKRYDECYY